LGRAPEREALGSDRTRWDSCERQDKRGNSQCPVS